MEFMLHDIDDDRGNFWVIFRRCCYSEMVSYAVNVIAKMFWIEKKNNRKTHQMFFAQIENKMVCWQHNCLGEIGIATLSPFWVIV